MLPVPGKDPSDASRAGRMLAHLVIQLPCMLEKTKSKRAVTFDVPHVEVRIPDLEAIKLINLQRIIDFLGQRDKLSVRT